MLKWLAKTTKDEYNFLSSPHISFWLNIFEGTSGQTTGILNLKIADISKDHDLLVSARECVMDLLNDDENLEKKENLINNFH